MGRDLMSNHLHDLIRPEPTALPVPGLTRPVTLLQLTDSHLCHADERESAHTRQAALDRVRCFSRYPGAGTEDIFEEHLRYTAECAADLLVLTGDILDFPSQQNIEELDRLLNRSGSLEYLFVTGNHDHDRFSIIGSLQAGQWDRSILSPFMGIDGHEQRDLAGATLIGIDNTDYQVTDAQLAALRDALAQKKPCILFLHIPLYEPTLEGPLMRVWKSPIVMGIPDRLYAERPGVIPAPRPTGLTREFCRLCGEAANLLAVFSGHLHFSHCGPLASGNPQYVTAPGFEGGCRVISLTPA